MIVVPAGRLFYSIPSLCQNISGTTVRSNALEQVRHYAARRGTREKADKKKAALKKLRASQPPVKSKVQSKKIIISETVKDDSMRPDPVDNVYFQPFYKWTIYSLEQAIQNHRETFHPTILNQSDPVLEAAMEFDMKTKKIGKRSPGLMGGFTELIAFPHIFLSEEYVINTTRNVIAFCKSPDEKEKAIAAGATTVGGTELIKNIQSGKVSLKNFDYCVAHVDILADLLLLRGLMKRTFPNIHMGTLGNNMTKLVEKFVKSIPYNVNPHPHYPAHATANIPFAKLDMDIKEIEENFSFVVNTFHNRSPNPPQSFIKRIFVKCPPSDEVFKVDFQQYLPEQEEPKKVKGKEEKDEDDEEEDASAAVIGTV